MNFFDDDDFGIKPFDDPPPPPPLQQVPAPCPSQPSDSIMAETTEDPAPTVQHDPAPTPSQPANSLLARAVKKPSRKRRRYTLTTEHAEMLVRLTHFRPVEELRMIEDVYRNLVVFEGNFEQTQYDFQKLGLGRLTHDAERRNGSDVYLGWVRVEQFVLGEGMGRTAKIAKRTAMDAFHSNAKIHCYRLEYLKPAKALKQPRSGIPDYIGLIRKFRRESIEQELIFGTEFDKQERAKLIKYAHKLDLKAINFGPNSCLQLKVFGLPIPALVILERILVQKDPKVCALYQVIPPRVGARRIC